MSNINALPNVQIIMIKDDGVPKITFNNCTVHEGIALLKMHLLEMRLNNTQIAYLSAYSKAISINAFPVATGLVQGVLFPSENTVVFRVQHIHWWGATDANRKFTMEILQSLIIHLNEMS